MRVSNYEIDNTRKKIEELGMFCVQYGIEKEDLHQIVFLKRQKKEKEEVHERFTKKKKYD